MPWPLRTPALLTCRCEEAAIEQTKECLFLGAHIPGDAAVTGEVTEAMAGQHQGQVTSSWLRSG